MLKRNDNLHIGFEKRHGKIFLGEGQAIPGCETDWKSKSGDRTLEVMKVIAARFKFFLDKENQNREVKKPYVCYELPGVGKKLVYIEGNYGFDIKPGVKKKPKTKRK